MTKSSKLLLPHSQAPTSRGQRNGLAPAQQVQACLTSHSSVTMHQAPLTEERDAENGIMPKQVDGQPRKGSAETSWLQPIKNQAKREESQKPRSH